MIEAPRIRAGDQVAFGVDRQRAHVRLLGPVEHAAFTVRRDAVNLALVAGGDEEIALMVEHHGPDVFRLGLVEDGRLAIAVDAIDAPVGRSRGVYAVARIHGQRVNLQRVQVRYELAFAVGPDAVELRARAAGPQVALRIARQRPQVTAVGS